MGYCHGYYCSLDEVDRFAFSYRRYHVPYYNVENKPITVFGEGSQKRSFTYVTDEIEGLLKAAFFENISGKVINFGNDEKITIFNLAKTVKTFVNLPQKSVF